MTKQGALTARAGIEAIGIPLALGYRHSVLSDNGYLGAEFGTRIDLVGRSDALFWSLALGVNF
jgi:hypothetical protein